MTTVKKLVRILALTHNPPSEGCAAARLVAPLQALQNDGKVEYSLVQVTPWWFRRQGAYRRLLGDVSNWDVIWIARPLYYAMLPVIREARKHGKPILVDIDDWLLDVPVDHHDAAFLRNSALQATLRRSLRGADAVTVSTPAIAERCAEIGLTSHLLPNAIDTSQFLRWPKDNTSVTIAFCGGLNHAPDVSLISSPLLQLLQDKRTGVRVVSIGCPIPELAGIEGYTHYDQVAATEYPCLLSSLRVDIGLAPLHDTPFNRAKSDIKYLEYSATGAVTIASPVGPYKASARANRGVLVESNTPQDWLTAIRGLLQDVRARQSLAEEAYRWVRNTRSIDAGATAWYDVFDAYAKERPPVSRPVDHQLESKRFKRELANIALRELYCFGRRAPAVLLQRLT